MYVTMLSIVHSSLAESICNVTLDTARIDHDHQALMRIVNAKIATLQENQRNINDRLEAKKRQIVQIERQQQEFDKETVQGRILRDNEIEAYRSNTEQVLIKLKQVKEKRVR